MTIYVLSLYIAISAIILTALHLAVDAERRKFSAALGVSYLQNFVGSLLLFSGFVKAVDPMGTAYKMEDYFAVFKEDGLPFMDLFTDFSVAFSVGTIVLELLLGVLLLLGVARRATTIFNLALMVFFTFLTGYTAYTGKVTDCGCFGDFLKLKPIVSFSKDIVFTLMSIVLVVGHKKIFQVGTPILRNGITAAALLGSWLFCLMNYYWGLPVFDFRPFYEGVNIPQAKLECEQNVPEVKLTYYYQNLQNPEEIMSVTSEQISSEYEKYQDLFDTQKWQSLDSLIEEEVIKEGCDSKIKEFNFKNAEDSEMTDKVTENPNYNFLVIAYDLDNSSETGFEKVSALAQSAQQAGLETNAVYAIYSKELQDLKQRLSLNFPFFSADAIMLKTIVRSNPGVLLLKNGTIVKKWHHKNLPSFEEIQQTHMK